MLLQAIFSSYFFSYITDQKADEKPQAIQLFVRDDWWWGAAMSREQQYTYLVGYKAT